jgi:hypothetical protein
VADADFVLKTAQAAVASVSERIWRDCQQQMKIFSTNPVIHFARRNPLILCEFSTSPGIHSFTAKSCSLIHRNGIYEVHLFRCVCSSQAGDR